MYKHFETVKKEHDITSLIPSLMKKVENQQRNHVRVIGIVKINRATTFKLMSKHMVCVYNLVKSDQTVPDKLVTTVIIGTKQKSTIPRVIEQCQFRRKNQRFLEIDLNEWRHPTSQKVEHKIESGIYDNTCGGTTIHSHDE